MHAGKSEKSDESNRKKIHHAFLIPFETQVLVSILGEEEWRYRIVDSYNFQNLTFRLSKMRHN